MASVLETHPRRAEVDALLMEGLSTRKIVARLGLQYAHSVVADYRRKVFIPNTRIALKLMNRQPESVNITDSTMELAKTTRAVSAAEPILRKVSGDEETLKRAVAGAEQKGDYRGVADVIRTKHSGYRLEAELTGVLNTNVTTVNQIMLCLPSPDAEPAAADVVDVEVLGASDAPDPDAPSGE